MLLAEAFAYWAAASTRREATLRNYHNATRRLSRNGLLHVEDVTRERIVEIQHRMLARGLGVHTVRAEFVALFSVLGLLEAHGRIPEDTVSGLRKVSIKRGKGGERRRRVPHLSWIEAEHLARTAERYEPRLELPIRVDVLSGPRVSELARIRAEDYQNGAFSVETLPEWGEAGSCKTGPRVVPVCAELAALFRDRLPRTGWIFPSGKPRGAVPRTPFLSRWTLESKLARVRKLADLPHVTFTILRHTRASWWLQDGRSIYKVADWLGHSVQTCETYYGSLLDGYDPDCERAA
jgi:integrase